MSDENITTDVKQEADTKVDNNDTRPAYRFNEVVAQRNELREQLADFKQKEDNAKKAKLEEENKWQELNAELSKELDSYKPYKEKWDSMDVKLRENALSKLPENKREKFSSIDTDVLLDIVEEFSERKQNPPDRKGTVPKAELANIHDMTPEERKRNWGQILDSYRR